MVYKLRNGHTIIARDADGGATEFETINPAGETISSVTLGREAAREVLIGCAVARSLRR